MLLIVGDADVVAGERPRRGRPPIGYDAASRRAENERSVRIQTLQGRSALQIAMNLRVSPRTVSRHRARLRAAGLLP
jgi:DNA-binding transcriptional ArsR family regulator